MKDSSTIFEKSKPGRRCIYLPDPGSPLPEIPAHLRREQDAELPEVGEIDLIRHYTNLSRKAFGVDNGFYPLGSCTMKYNPKINEDVAALPGFAQLHPLQEIESTQGALEVLYNLSQCLCDITGMDHVTLQPAAGAQGEFTGLMLIKNYLRSQKGGEKRTKVLVPDSAHGTNPASATMCGFQTVSLPSTPEGYLDMAALRAAVGEDTAALMLTNPSTLGLFERNIQEISKVVHDAGGLLYYDGANLNAIMGYSRPGDMGFDVIHLNLHKTFSTPHGGGGPGSGPVGCKNLLASYLPNPRIVKKDGTYTLDCHPQSVGKLRSFYGNFLVALRAYAYILSNGAKGLKEVSESAVLNANYLLDTLEKYYDYPFEKPCMHEFVLSLAKIKKDKGVSAADVSKRLIDYGMHPPTMYFPLIVPEALMVEPTETESRETLDKAAEIFIKIRGEIDQSPDRLHQSPVSTVIRRVDEVTAARNPKLLWTKEG